MGARYWAWLGFAVMMLAAGSLLALPKLSVFQKLDAIEATVAASKEKALVLQGDVDRHDEGLDTALAEAEVARRAAIPLRLSVNRATQAWLSALATTDADRTTESDQLSYLLRRASGPALSAKLAERGVLDRADLLRNQYDVTLFFRTQSTVALAQAKAGGEAADSSRNAVIKSADPKSIRDETRETDEALNRSLSHLLKYSTDRDFHRLKGTLIPPVKGGPKQPFGPKATGHKISIRHTGLTYQVKTGTPVRATAAGLVVYAHRFEGYGNMVIVDHGQEYHSIYAHLDRIDVKLDTKVKRGETVGLSGESGSLTGPKLYFELRKNGRAIDPESWFLQRQK